MPLARQANERTRAADPVDADAQNDRIGAPRLQINGKPPTAQIGGYRAAATASDHHAARPAFRGVSEPSAESARLSTASARWVAARRSSAFARCWLHGGSRASMAVWLRRDYISRLGEDRPGHRALPGLPFHAAAGTGFMQQPVPPRARPRARVRPHRTAASGQAARGL